MPSPDGPAQEASAEITPDERLPETGSPPATVFVLDFRCYSGRILDRQKYASTCGPSLEQIYKLSSARLSGKFFRIRTYKVRARNSFRIRTYKTPSQVRKTKDLQACFFACNSTIINTYEPLSEVWQTQGL